MLRTALLIFTALALGVGLMLIADGDPAGRPVAIWGGLMLLAVLLERWRYVSARGPLSPDWVRTEERFVDPESGETLRVFYNPKTGERRYEKSAETDS